MGAIIWTDTMLDTLRAEFPTAFNKDLARKVGVSPRTLIRKARELGLEKVVTFMDDHREEINKALKLGQKISTNTNWRKTQFKKGHPANEYTFRAGMTFKERFGEEKERQRILKAAKSRAETFRLEKARAAFCLPQKTKLRVTQQSRRKISQNHYLRKRGYVLEIKHGIAYYDENTLRAKTIEKRQRFFKFKPKEL